ncbi:MAG: fumarylacetoacetate hydrolase family protein [Gemmobacter sp.]|nr:fumarylacetoacetate hydrolase family protein [Gemmobacter sp.]
MPSFAIAPPPVVTLAIAGSDQVFPVRRVYCIGRNYAAHAIEMGHDPSREAPFFFQKNPDNLYVGDTFAYPSQSTDVHHEIELVVALKSGGVSIPVDQALDHVWGYGVGLDMTRRDLQAQAKAAGRPWEIGKAFERSGPVSALKPVEMVGHPAAGLIQLKVNGTPRQTGDLNQLIWKVPEMIAYLSDYFELAAGDVIMTGTPSGVGEVHRGDVMDCHIDGVADLSVTVI